VLAYHSLLGLWLEEQHLPSSNQPIQVVCRRHVARIGCSGSCRASGWDRSWFPSTWPCTPRWWDPRTGSVRACRFGPLGSCGRRWIAGCPWRSGTSSPSPRARCTPCRASPATARTWTSAPRRCATWRRGRCRTRLSTCLGPMKPRRPWTGAGSWPWPWSWSWTTLL